MIEPLLKQAEQEAADLGHNYVGSEHLVLAIAQKADVTLAALLEQSGADHERIKAEVIELLRGPS